MSNYNSFCVYCVSNSRYCSSEKREEIAKCEFKSCPFWRERFASMEWQLDKKFKRELTAAVKKCNEVLKQSSRS